MFRWAVNYSSKGVSDNPLRFGMNNSNPLLALTSLGIIQGEAIASDVRTAAGLPTLNESMGLAGDGRVR